MGIPIPTAALTAGQQSSQTALTVLKQIHFVCAKFYLIRYRFEAVIAKYTGASKLYPDTL